MKFMRYIQKKRRAMLALAALTIFTNPFSAHASNITTKDGVTLNPTDNVYNIAVQKTLSNSVGVNKFTDFNLDAGQIANMQFDKLTTLANLVDNKININGTVNALRDGKIGGNLYFLSPNGIAVGASGVINAGSFTGMAVSEDYFKKLSDMDNASKFTTALKPENIEYNNDPDKGIDIQGVINAPGGINLYATKIDVGSGAILRTDVSEVDFSKVVNVENVNSGITGGLDASYKDGDIVLKARAEQVLDDSELDEVTDETAANWEKISQREAVINVDGKITSAKDLTINAESVITFKEGEKFNVVTQTKGISNFLKDFNNDWSVNFAKKTNKATVNIGSNADLYSAGNMNISATAELTAQIETVTPAKGNGNSWVPATAVGVIVASNEAAVNVDGKLKSDGQMAINAKATTSLTVDAQTKTELDADNSDAQENKMFIAVGVINGTTKAEVNINSGDEIKVGGNDSSDSKAFEANAIVENSISNSVNASSEDKSTVNTAVGVANYTSNATVNVDRAITAENGSIKIDATNTTSNTNSTSNVFGTSVAPFENPFETDDEEDSSTSEDNATEATEAVNDAIKNATDKINEKISSSEESSDKKSTVPDEAGGSTFSKVMDGNYFKAGVAVGVFSQTNSANVNVKSNANLTAKKDVAINATKEISRQKLSVESIVNNQTEDQKTAAMIGLGVLVSDIDNNADVVIDGTLNANEGDVKITSDSGMKYDQFSALVEDLTDALEEIKEDAQSLGEEVKDEIKEKIDGYTEKISGSKSSDDKKDTASSDDAKNFMSNISNLSSVVTDVTNDIKSASFTTITDKIKDSKLKADIDDLPTKLTAFLRPANYANYYVRSAFADTQSADSANSTKIDAAGSISVDTLINNSRVLLNKDSNIKAEKGTVEVNSNAKGGVVAITGMGGEYLQSSTASNAGAGISVMVGKFDNNSLVTVGKSDLKGNDVKIKAEENSKHVNLIYGNGKADSTSITGMVSYIKSPTDSIISIDDSAKLDATNNLNLEATGEDYITSVNGALTLGNGNGKSFGAAVNVLSNDKNTAVFIGDNGKVDGLDDKIKTLENTISTESDADKIIADKTDLKILKINKRTHEILGENYLNKLDASAVNSDGLINAKNLTVKADNTGTINAIAVEGTENSDSHGMADAFNNTVTRGQTAIDYSNDAFKAMPNMLTKVFSSDKKSSDSDAAPPALDKSGKDTPTNAQNDANTSAGGDEAAAPPVNADNASSQLNVAGAGSGAINITGGETGSFISNAKITADNVDVSANDDVFHGSWAGAGAFNFFGNSQAAKNTNVAIGGAVAYTDTNQNVNSIIKNTAITASSIKNTATRDDSDVSAGLGLAVSTNSADQGTNVDVGISASINFIEGDTHALLIGNRVQGLGTSVENKASLDSLQIAGGVDIALSTGGGTGVNVGGSGVASKITNDLQSGILGGSYENLGNVDINANKKADQIDVAVGGGANFGSNTKGFAFGGAVAVSDITNNSRAFLNKTTKFQSSGTVNVDAFDTKNSGTRNDYLSARSINTDPTSFLSDDDKGKINLDGGNSIVNVALGIGGSTGQSGAGGIGVSYAGIANLMNVDINDNTLIDVKDLNANINGNDTGKNNVVNVTIGFAGSNKSFAGAGAAGVTDIKSDAVINANSNVNADSFLSAANSSSHIVNVAGQASLADSFSGGLTFAYNAMNNNTAANVNGGTWKVKNLSSAATNNNYALAIGAGVTYSDSTGAINGAVGLNMGDNSTNSIVNGSTISGVENLKVNAIDNTSKTTVAGDITISNKGKVAAGGAVAYANIGDSSDKEVINAKITNANITTADNAAINVNSLDNANMTTVGVGVGLAISEAYGSFNGAAAVSEVNKENVAEISNTSIDEDNENANSNVTINAVSGKNTPDKLIIDGSSTDVDNKINTAAAVLDLNFSKSSLVNGAVAVSVNKFNQSTEANFKHDTLSEEASNVGNVSMNSNSNADILGVAIGGAGGKSTLSAAGSVSYNYIDNSAKTLVEKENVKAAKNFGVVVQSDDLLANYAGAIDISGGRGSVGVSVAYNEIKGNTDALVNNSKLNVTGSTDNTINFFNPKGNLIDDYVTKNTWTSGGLLDGRTAESKSGLVVNSSATHSISSDLATIGVRLSNDLGVGVSGTVNINKFDGATNAKVENTDVTATNADTFVNASDYTNNGSFIGNAAVSGTVAIGALWNENQINRETNALVDGGTLNVKNLDVKADSEQGLSNLNIAVGASFATSSDQVFAAASGDNVVRNQMEGTTTAKIENATVNHSGAVDVNAYHKDNAFATNLAVGAAIDLGGSAGATFDLGYGLMREDSTVEAEINNSTLTSEEKGAVNVNAENNSKIAGAFGTAGVAVHAGNPGVAASVAVGINNNYVTDTVKAAINDSTLDVGAVDVNAKNTSEIKADGGVAAVAVNLSESFFASMGAAVAVTNATFDNKVTADVNKSKITAAGDVNINARDDHKSDETVVSAAISSGVAVEVNRMSTSINSGLANLHKNDLGKSVSADDLMTIDNASKSNATSASDKLVREYGAETRFLDEDTINSLLSGVHTDSAATKENISSTLAKRYTATVNYNNSLEKGVFANVRNESEIDAGENKISINSMENNDLSITSGGGNAALIAGIGVGSTSIEARRANVTNVVGSTLKAKNIDITTTNGQTGSDGILSKMYNATLSPLGVSVGYNNVETNGTGEILISDSTITAAENLNATAIDNSKSESYILDAGLKQIGYTGVFAYNTNTSQTGIQVSNKSTLDAKTINFNSENHSHRATDTLAISVSGTLGVQTNTSEASDTSTNFINVKGAGNTFTGDNLNFNALNGSQTYAHNNGQAYLGLNAIVASGLANAENTSAILIDDANNFKSNTINLTAQIGEAGKYTAQADGFAINASTVGVNVDDMTAKTQSTAQITIGNEIYGDATTLNAATLNKASRNAFMNNNAYAVVANANDISSYTVAKDKASITVGSDTAVENANKLAAMNISADTENKSYVAAEGTGGAIGGDFGSAAHADNVADNTSEAILNGKWDIAENLTLTANQHDSAYISGYSARGAILTGGKGSLDNEIKGSSTATISDGAIINAKTVNINSKNYIKTDKYSDEYDYTLFGRMGGVVDDVDYQTATATTNKTANINIGSNAAITTTGTQNYDALNDYDLKNDVYAEGGSLLASLRWVKSHNYITADEKISVGKNATLKNEGGTYEDGGITFAAHDKLELNPGSMGFSEAGLGGYVRAETLINLNRNPNITVDGTLKSAKDLNLYAGADINGSRAKVHANAKAVSQVQTLVTDGSADIIRAGANNASVNINSGAIGQATHDVNIISNAGYEVYEDFAFYGSTWSSEGGYKVATSDKGDVTTSHYRHNNKVKVDGELKAASTPDATINLSGIALPDGFVLTNNSQKPLSYSVTSGDVTITKYNDDFTGKSSEEIFAQQIYNGITTKTTDYANDYLLTRYDEVCDVISDYQVQGKESDVAAYNGFLQEKTALESEMVKLGMGSYVDLSDGTSQFKLGVTPSIKIKTVVIPDVEVSGGNINVNTGNFTGSGKLNASGVPKIDIQNDSSAYLVTNRLTIADKGGSINYNDTAVASNSEINNVNSFKSGANFSDVETANPTEIPTINVSNNYSGSGSISMKMESKPGDAEYNALPDRAKKETQRYTPINYIEVTKDITNPVGKVTLNSNQGSIRILSGANINAQDIAMTAKESISQGYTDGIVNIAYTPEHAYADEAKKLRESIGWDKDMPTSDQSITKTGNDLYTGGTGRIAGDAIYIAARDININGLIQAGFPSYKVKITQEDIDKATETVFFNDLAMYKVNNGGAKLGDKGYYIYEPQVYYDKANNELYVEDISSSGGKVYLAGRIFSTGNGKIVVADGTGNIEVTNTAAVDMNVGKVISTSGKAIIQIIDTEQDKLSEYSSDQTRTIENYSAWLADNSKGTVSIGDGLQVGNFAQYKPKTGLSYNWTEGTQQEKTFYFNYKEECEWWGLSSDFDSDLASRSVSYVDQTDPQKLDIGDGTYIGNGAATKNNLTLLAQNIMTKDSYGNYKIDGPYEHGFLGFYRDYYHSWTRTTGAKQIYQYAVKADYPISVGLIGEGTPTINLFNTSTAGGDLYLTGDIRNETANLNIRAQGGDIIQDGVTVATDNINLSARNNIKNIDVTNNRTNSLRLNAQSTSNAGSIDINVQGGVLDNQYLNGSVVVESLMSKNGEVSLTAQGNIRQETDATSINARNIKLEAKNGYIDLQIESNGKAALLNNVSAISAAANGDITLAKNDEADFRIGSIVSTTGDVNLTAKGKFVDALDKERDNAEIQTNDLVKSWIDMGLIAGTADYKGAYVNRLEKDRDAYRDDIKAQFSDYQTLLENYQSAETDYQNLKEDLDNSKVEKSERLQTLTDKFADYETAEAYLAADPDYQTAEDRDAYKVDITQEFDEYNLLLTAYNGAVANYEELKTRVENAKPSENDYLQTLSKKFANYETADDYLAADSDYQALVATAANPQYQWTQDDLLSGIRSAIVNKEEGTASDVTHLKDANITARNVTLTGAGVGTNTKEVTTINISDIIRKENETAEESNARLAALTKLANAEAADVTVNYALDAKGKPVTQKITRVNYRYDADNGYYIDKAGNYIRYRKDTDGKLIKYTYDNNFEQIGDAVAVSDFSDVIESTTVIENKEIKSFDITGTVPLGINATGNIIVKTNGNEGNYIVGRNKGVKIDETQNPNTNDYSALNIVSVETSKADGNYGDVRIIGEAGIFNANSDASAANVIGKDLVLVGGNDAIGTQDKPLILQLSGDLLSARSNEEINLRKTGADDFRISAVYSPKAICITNNDSGIIRRSTRFDNIAEAYLNTPGEITLTGSTGTADSPIFILPHGTTILNLKGNGDFYIKGTDDASKSIANGTITLNDISGNIDVSSSGSIKQTADGTNTLTGIKVAANGNVILSGNNKLSAVNVGTVGGNFALNNDSDKVTITFADKSKGNIEINQTGDIALEGALNGNVLSLTSEKGGITSTGGLKATKEINLNIGSFKHEGEIITDKLTLATDADAILTNTENTFRELTVSSRDGKAINGSVQATTKASTFTANINNDVAGDLILTNTKKTSGAISFGGKDLINVGGNFSLDTPGNINYDSTVLAGKDISITAQNIYRKPNTAGYFGTAGNFTLNVSKNIGTEDNPFLIGNTAEKGLGLNVYAGSGYLRGVNSGALWLGNITTNKTLNISSEDSIAQADNKKIDVSAINVAAANSITLDSADNIITKLGLNSLGANTKNSGSVSVNSISTKGLTLEGNLSTAGSVAINSAKALTLNNELEADKNIDLTAGGDIKSKDTSSVKAGEQITLTGNSFAFKGAVSSPKVIVTTVKGLDMRNAENKIDNMEIGTGSDKDINGAVTVTTNSSEFIPLFKNDVVNDITLTNNESDGGISLQSENAEYLRSTKGNITLDMDGMFILGRPLWARKDIAITTHNGLIFILNLSSETNNDTLNSLSGTINLNGSQGVFVDGRISAGKDIVATAEEGGITVYGDASIDASKDVTLTVDAGDIEITGTVVSNNGNIKMDAGAGNVNITGNSTKNIPALEAAAGDIDIKVNNGNITIGENMPENLTIFADGDINMKSTGGIITISGKAQSDYGNVNIVTKKANERVAVSYYDDGEQTLLAATDYTNKPGDVLINAEIEADHTVYITTGDGDIDINKKVLVTNGTVLILTVNGNVRIEDNGAEDMVTAQKEINILNSNGAITIAGKISTQDGDIKITRGKGAYTAGQKSITVEETGAVNSAKDIWLHILNDDIYVTDKYNAKNDIIIDVKERGDIYLEGINATGSVNATTENGKIIQTGTLHATGDIDITNNAGDIELNKIKSQNATIKAVNGNVTGNTIKAGETVRIELEHGNLYLNLAEGKGVVILVGNDSNSTVNRIKADSVDVDRNLVKVGRVTSSYGGSGSNNTIAVSSNNRYSDILSNNFASNRSTTLGTTLTTYWQSAISAAETDYSFSEFELDNDLSYRQTRNYFAVRFIPTWLDEEFFDIDFNYSFDNFGIRNATEDELIID